MNLIQNRHLYYLIAIIFIACSLASINFPFGFSEDSDGYSIVRHALELPINGYHKSRTFGFPLYELIAYPIICYLGIFYAKLYSMVFYVLSSIVLYFTILKLTSDSLKSFIGTLSFVFLPISIISGNTVLETSQGIFFALLGLYFYIGFYNSYRRFDFYLMSAFLGIATSTRPDYVILSSAIALTILKFAKVNFRDILWGIFIWVAFTFLPFSIYTDAYFSKDVISLDPLIVRIGRVIFGYIAIIGVPASILIVFYSIVRYKSLFDTIKQVFKDNFLFLFSVSFILYSIRFLILPDELEYVYVLVPLFILVIVRLNVSKTVLAILAVAIAIPNLIEVHFFTRNKEAKVVFDLGISPGVIVQDRSGRLKNEYKYNELRSLIKSVAEKYGYSNYSGKQSTKPGTLVIISEEELRFYRPDRVSGKYYKALKDVKIVTYPMPSNRGWRHSLKFIEWKKVSLSDFKEAEGLQNLLTN